jgi:predicted N-formylglutamate amidohydrolase
LIYSAERHAEQHGRVALEIELRQDHALDPAMRRRVARALTTARW